MSTRRIPPFRPDDAAPQRSHWRFFPHAVVASMAVVVAVNFGMVWSAEKTFPGVATRDSFDHSNSYDAVLATAAHEAALGWKLDVDLAGTRPRLVLLDRKGVPLVGARITGEAVRPLGPDATVPLTFHATAGGYEADKALTEPGQWELRLAAMADGATLHATRRVVVK